VGAEQIQELLLRELTQVEWFPLTTGLTKDAPVGRRDHKNSIVSEQTGYFGKNPRVFRYVLNELERNHGSK
jgi:hypothetical protein